MVIPASKNKDEIVIEVGKWYTTFTTGSDDHMGHQVDDYLFKVDSIENGAAHIATVTSKKKELKKYRYQFTTNIMEADLRYAIIRLFRNGLKYK